MSKLAVANGFRCRHRGLKSSAALNECLERIVSNPLSNAVKYSPHGSDVVISVWEELAWAGDGRCVALWVRDWGIGLPAEDLPHVFDLYRARNAVGRFLETGLGLAAARQMVADHGGTYVVRGNP